MKAACLLYSLLLLIEGVLAWMQEGQAFLLAVGVCTVLIYAALCGSSRGVAEGVRLSAAAALAIGAPFYYQTQTGLLLCFVALPHLLASTQTLWEMAWGAQASTESLRRTRSIVFSIAFYASMALVFLLLRGLSALTAWQSGVLGLVVLAAALPAWDASRLLRLKPGSPDRHPDQPAPSRLPGLLATTGLLAALIAIFAFLLPAASDFLCRISPRWKAPDLDFRNRPPHTPPMGDDVRMENLTPPEQDTGLDSASTGSHQLPNRAKINPSGDIVGYFQVPDPAQYAEMAAGPVYLRSHAMARFEKNTWYPGGQETGWHRDADDGAEDGWITFAPPEADAIRYSIYLYNTTGVNTPVLPGLRQIALPRLFQKAGDLLQHDLAGDLQYDAVSRPLVFDRLTDTAWLKAGEDTSRVHMGTGDVALTSKLRQLANSAMDHGPLLADRISDLQRWFNDHYQYSLTVENPQDLGPLENFLLVERKGYCDFYASAATLLLRAAGVPARVAYGYAVQKPNAEHRVWTVTGRNAHAWTEILVEDKGWVVCDFTPRSEIGNLGRDREKESAAPDFDPAQFTPAASIPPQNPPGADNTTPLAALSPKWQPPAWLPTVLQALPLVLTGGAVIALLTWLHRRRSREKAKAAKAAIDERQPAYYEELIRICTAAGYPRPAGATPREYLEHLSAAGLPITDRTSLLAYHYQLRYEDASPDPARESSFLEMVRTLARVLASRKEQPIG